MPPEFLTTQDVAALLKIHPMTLHRWRVQGRGPTWVEVEGSIRYGRGALEAWIAHRTRNGTAADGA